MTMIQVNSDSHYYLVFAPDTVDGMFSSFVVKFAYDNNLYNELWDRNVQCYLCGASQNLSLDWFKEKIISYANEVKAKDSSAAITVMFLNYFIKTDNGGIKLFNICTGLGLDLVWICNDIDLIENFKHLNLPGSQVITNDSCAMQVWKYLKDNDKEMKSMDLPVIFRLADAFHKGPADGADFSWDSQTMPFICYLDSFDKNLNDNECEFVKFIANAMRSNDLLMKTVSMIGKPIYSFMKNMQNESVEHFFLRGYGKPVED